MKINTLLTLIGLSGSALSASVPVRTNHESRSYTSIPKRQSEYGSAPFGYRSGTPISIANLKGKIENVVWIILENRAFDNILGGVHYPGLDNVVNNGPFHTPENVSKPETSKHYSSIVKDFDSVLQDPDHSVTGNNYELYVFIPQSHAG